MTLLTIIPSMKLLLLLAYILLLFLHFQTTSSSDPSVSKQLFSYPNVLSKFQVLFFVLFPIILCTLHDLTFHEYTHLFAKFQQLEPPGMLIDLQLDSPPNISPDYSKATPHSRFKLK